MRDASKFNRLMTIQEDQFLGITHTANTLRPTIVFVTIFLCGQPLLQVLRLLQILNIVCNFKMCYLHRYTNCTSSTLASACYGLPCFYRIIMTCQNWLLSIKPILHNPPKKSLKRTISCTQKTSDPKSSLAHNTEAHDFMLICTYITLPVCIPLPFKLVYFCLFRRYNTGKWLDLGI